MTNSNTIEYFYSAHSAYAYLGAWELARIAKNTGWHVEHRPFDLNPVMAAAGAKAFPDRTAAHVEYFFGRELVRWSQLRDLPMIRHRPTFHDNPLDLANGMIIAAADEADTLSRAILQAHWRDDADIADRATLVALADDLGVQGTSLLNAAESHAVQAQHRANTAEAIERNTLGSPTYFVRGDMFYGQDRLDMLARAINEPFAP